MFEVNMIVLNEKVNKGKREREREKKSKQWIKRERESVIVYAQL